MTHQLNYRQQPLCRDVYTSLKKRICYANIAERDTGTDRQTDTQTDRQTSRQTDGQADGQSGVRQTQRYGDGEEERGQTELLRLA